MSSVSNGHYADNGFSAVDCQCDAQKLIWDPSEHVKKEAYLSSMDEYHAMHKESVSGQSRVQADVKDILIMFWGYFYMSMVLEFKR